MDWKDILTRTAKTFAQAFLGVFVPVLVSYLNNGWPESVDALWVALAPTVAAALAAGICAVWNTAAQALQNE